MLKPKEIYYIVTDISNHIFFLPVSMHQDKTKETFIKILYRDKGIDLINLPNSLHNMKDQCSETK